jgi:hypothetical protein
MSSLLRTLFGVRKDEPKMHETSSFNDLSLGCGQDAEEVLGANPAKVDASVSSQEQHKSPAPSTGAKGGTVWRSVFNPGSNPATKNAGTEYFDRVDDSKPKMTTWDHIIMAERKKAFDSLDKTADGYIDAADLTATLGHSQGVEDLIKKADKNGDGKIDYKEFCELLKVTHSS